MAGKRRATSELNRDNWDQEDPSEESGVYTRASEEVLKKRVFKTAKRRIAKSPEEGTINAFNSANLANLTSKSHQPANQLFSFLSEMKADTSKTNGVNNKLNNQDGKLEASSLFSFGKKAETTEITKSSSSENNNHNSEDKSKQMFSFGDGISKVDNKTAGSSMFSFGNSNNSEKLQPSENKKDKTNIQNEKTTDNLDHYYARLKGLNESVAKWINNHVENNPLINLQPIFKDYEKFFDEIEKEYHKTDSNVLNIQNNKQNENKGFNFTSSLNKNETTTAMNTFKFSSTPVDKNTTSASVDKNSTSCKIEVPSASLFKFGASNSTNDNSSEKIQAASPASTFKFGPTNVSTNVSTSKTDQVPFKFGNPSTSEVKDAKAPSFSFGGNSTGFGGGFNFAANPTPPSTGAINFGSVPSNTPANDQGNADEEESEEPPKVEVKEVEEEGQFYTIRCKLFVKKDGNFVEKGVGNLILKPVPDSDKVQVIVRAHNSLANVLCNFILSKSIPTQRVGKNNVMIVCIPTPESKPPPIPVLIKVKTGEDADQLHETLEKHKK
ncbi:nuclear pore complex protein Nup50 isoform X1 [Harmonia axyridis]|uniref:nuclear pore complex protein Nup50 isoform X1 n=2 Tax=Harmonia axyridis TaxID=115357 RepID=UPI001E274E9E|nr:nuclear pore complex protein Nup50 isoform X1 [Harmonia axyridis]